MSAQKICHTSGDTTMKIFILASLLLSGAAFACDPYTYCQPGQQPAPFPPSTIPTQPAPPPYTCRTVTVNGQTMLVCG